jgi:four helix bundle protein
MGNFQELKVWQRAKELAVCIYRLTSVGKFSKDNGLRDQIRRACISIPSNIAEGDESGSDKQAVKFFYVAKASAAELLTQTMISGEIGYLTVAETSFVAEECKGISAMLAKLIKVRSKA